MVPHVAGGSNHDKFWQILGIAPRCQLADINGARPSKLD